MNLFRSCANTIKNNVLTLGGHGLWCYIGLNPNPRSATYMIWAGYLGTSFLQVHNEDNDIYRNIQSERLKLAVSLVWAHTRFSVVNVIFLNLNTWFYISEFNHYNIGFHFNLIMGMYGKIC